MSIQPVKNFKGEMERMGENVPFEITIQGDGTSWISIDGEDVQSQIFLKDEKHAKYELSQYGEVHTWEETKE